ncbi:MAG TPA: GyrI-like domain-containing protein [Nocardioides sp.]|nr:GyrI-like domain-containing protein [Nocardioides sp.]
MSRPAADVWEVGTHLSGSFPGGEVDLRMLFTHRPGGIYDNTLFEEGRGHVMLHMPTPYPPRRGRVHPVTLPPVELAVATHVGPHDNADVTYGELGSWVVANALAVAGPVRETYLVTSAQDPDPSAWRTEIGWPIFRMP